ncbi:hypothetical protein ACEW7V_00355 [Areca yellow leaf disease phytoplasma]
MPRLYDVCEGAIKINDILILKNMILIICV